MSACEITAGDAVSSLKRDNKRPAVAMKPSKATSTAACIRCFLRLSFDLDAIPNPASAIPKNAGINAVTLARSPIIPLTYPAAPRAIKMTPKNIAVFGIYPTIYQKIGFPKTVACN